jgi:hypothetical protein
VPVTLTADEKIMLTGMTSVVLYVPFAMEEVTSVTEGGSWKMGFVPGKPVPPGVRTTGVVSSCVQLVVPDRFARI